MGHTGKLSSQMTLKSDPSKFYEQMRFTPYQFPDVSPQIIQSVELSGGQWGAVGSIVCWNFTDQDGKKVFSKEMIEAAEDQGRKKMVTYKVIGGDVLEMYKAIKSIIEVEAIGEDNVVTWTLEYEKKTEETPEPKLLMDICLAFTKDIERHHLLVSN